jgi:hypothetical protein
VWTGSRLRARDPEPAAARPNVPSEGHLTKLVTAQRAVHNRTDVRYDDVDNSPPHGARAPQRAWTTADRAWTTRRRSVDEARPRVETPEPQHLAVSQRIGPQHVVFEG